MARRQAQKEENLLKMLRYVLGVAPAEFGLLPDDEGWLPVKELLQALHQEEGWRHVRQGMIDDACMRLDDGTLEIDDKRIRSVERGYARPEYGLTPPAHLYLGARRRAWPVMIRRGLEPLHDGRMIMLASDQEESLRLGQRRDSEPVLVTVQAHQAMDQGVVFAGWGGFYLCDWAPASCLMGPPVEERPAPRPKPTKPKKEAGPAMPGPDALPGSFALTPEDMEKPYKRKGIKKDVPWKDQRRKDRRRKK